MTDLDEADIVASLPEALTADVEAVFPNETGSMCANAATSNRRWSAS